MTNQQIINLINYRQKYLSHYMEAKDSETTRLWAREIARWGFELLNRGVDPKYES